SSAIIFGDASPPVSADTDELCYKVSWNLNSQVPAEGVIKPIIELPGLHPSAGRTICGTTRNAGDRIDATEARSIFDRKASIERIEVEVTAS
ncbi:MAG: hypothetical protein CMJ27_13355, partial [Phycisphaerae bacterium]|nr:hypothetical protein [Phycisphaerae bacterium]